MRKEYYRDWQENAGYESYLENQSNELQSKNEKVDGNDAVKLSNARDGTDDKPYIRQQA